MITAQSTVPLEVTVQSNAKLLKALIALLSIKDDHLLEELKTIFKLAARSGSEIGDADPAVWAEIGRRLDVIDALVHDESLSDGQAGVGSH